MINYGVMVPQWYPRGIISINFNIQLLEIIGNLVKN